MKVHSPPPAVTQKPRRRRMRRTGLVLLALLAVGGIAGTALEWFSDRPDLLLVRHVRPGMTEADVTTVFGARPSTVRPWQLAGLTDPPEWRGRTKYWHCDAGFVEVVFNEDGRVNLFKQFSYGYGGEHPTKRKLRNLLAWVRLGWLIP
jgi:hypothetical protein